MKDLLEYIKSWYDSVAERVKMPILNSFLISWIIINWKIVLILLFSDTSIESRIAMVSHISDSTQWHVYLVPVLLAIAYTFGRPYLLGFIHRRLENINFNNFSSKIDYSKKSSIKRRELIKVKREEEVVRAGQLEYKALNDEIEKLKNQLDEKNEKISDLSNENKSYSEEIASKNTEIKEFKEKNEKALSSILKQLNPENLSQDPRKSLEISLLENVFYARRNIREYQNRRIRINNDNLIALKRMGFDKIWSRILNGEFDIENIYPDLEIEYFLQQNLIFKVESEKGNLYVLTELGLAYEDPNE
ncbi:coiled-coil domain-containing protein [Cyclobacterium salsum]|uniref:coiled-coil domain-containing protein n=1 Tax=Cyclobacterium salsum TaxID=2666329 RepID=UPI001390EC25|nr:hypothetical protein [Cyclobacterium salsum]